MRQMVGLSIQCRLEAVCYAKAGKNAAGSLLAFIEDAAHTDVRFLQMYVQGHLAYGAHRGT